jgi:hypothetical protein
MGLVLTATVGLILWIVLWALGWSGLDGALISLAILIVGATVHVAARYLPGRRT